MPPKEKIERETLRAAIKTLIIQEVRVLQLGQTHTPPFVIQEMIRSIQEAKRQVIVLLRVIPSKERNALIKRVIRQSVSEEIEWAIESRNNRCIRCLHVRYFDEAGVSYRNLPLGMARVRIIGCEVTPRSTKMQCQKFVERPMAHSVQDYLSEMAFLYEIKEMFDQFSEIWRDYFLNK